MAIVKKTIKKAKLGAVCGPGIKCPKPPGSGRMKGEGIGGIFTRMREASANRRGERQLRREEREYAKGLTKGPRQGFERDFPGDVSPGGFTGDRGGDKGTKWTSTRDNKLGRVNKGLKSGGKVKAKSNTKIKSVTKSKKK